MHIAVLNEFPVVCFANGPLLATAAQREPTRVSSKTFLQRIVEGAFVMSTAARNEAAPSK